MTQIVSGQKRSAITREKMSKSHLGKKVTQETKNKISTSSKGKDLHGVRNPFFGKKHTEETKQKIRDNHPYKGKKGSDTPAWKGGGISWAKREVKERDDFTCRHCGLREPDIMVVDHTKPKALFPELSVLIENMVTLCPNCHARKTLIDVRDLKITTINRKKI